MCLVPGLKINLSWVIELNGLRASLLTITLCNCHNIMGVRLLRQWNNITSLYTELILLE